MLFKPPSQCCSVIAENYKFSTSPYDNILVLSKWAPRFINIVSFSKLVNIWRKLELQGKWMHLWKHCSNWAKVEVVSVCLKIGDGREARGNLGWEVINVIRKTLLELPNQAKVNTLGCGQGSGRCQQMQK